MSGTKGNVKNIGKWILRVLIVLFTVIIFFAAVVYFSLKTICADKYPVARQTLVTTLLETGQLKFLVSWFLSPEEIQAVVNSNSMEVMTDKVNSALISISAAEDNKEDNNTDSGKDIEIINIAGRNYSGTLMKVKDPSRISLATIYPWRDKGVTLDQLVNGENAIAGINGGLYDSQNNTGGKPLGVLVSKGEIQRNEPQECGGLVLVGFTEDNILQIIDINGMNKKDVEELIKENRIRDAVCFQEEYSDANNHFVQLIINGNTRGMNGLGSGLNPRTAIGQCADGSVLLLVTDGRGKAGHLGASAADLIEVMEKYGAVNAANLDGGSSSCMYYEGEYLMSSVTFYYSNYSWRLPAAFVIK
ncbi:MAG: phosphodiester glycosidase family protein [Ruminiclostridium sp.]|nr:phosphodiester glycosidase family protein [Ruminiclostridium sp.]